MATTEVISGEQRLLSRVLKKRAKGSLMEEQLSTEVNRRKLGDKNALIENARVIIADRLDETAKLEEYRENGNRTSVKEWQIPVSTVVYNVTAPIWRNMVRSAIDGLSSDINVVQPNGKWILCDADVGVIEKRHRFITDVDKETGREVVEDEMVEYLLFAFEYIDARGEKDLVYRNGKPVDGTQFNFQGLGPELAQALQQVSANKSSDQTGLIQQLVDQNKALIERIEALETTKTTKRSRSNKSKPVEESADNS
jgi:hypothetical protein